MTYALHEGDALRVLPRLPDASVDCVVSDPPYPEIDRAYGRWSEAEWFALMDVVVPQCRRVLKPTGSAVFILQPNSDRVGRMRTWLWDFLAKWGREWGVVQDAYWWNPSAAPTIHAHRDRGGMRPSVKTVVWLGMEDCYRSQEEVLLVAAEATLADPRIDRMELCCFPSGQSVRKGRALQTFRERGGVTPFNLLVCSNGDSTSSAGAHGHGAGTPLDLMRWWTRYLCPPGGTVLDPFGGSGTLALACACEGRDSILIERVPEYCQIIRKRMADAQGPLFAPPQAPPAPPPSLFDEGAAP